MRTDCPKWAALVLVSPLNFYGAILDEYFEWILADAQSSAAAV
jgi:hypothetical protein